MLRARRFIQNEQAVALKLFAAELCGAAEVRDTRKKPQHNPPRTTAKESLRKKVTSISRSFARYILIYRFITSVNSLSQKAYLCVTPRELKNFM